MRNVERRRDGAERGRNVWGGGASREGTRNSNFSGSETVPLSQGAIKVIDWRSYHWGGRGKEGVGGPHTKEAVARQRGFSGGGVRRA